jgi:V/A-type H+-transporting ATPase subunit E
MTVEKIINQIELDATQEINEILKEADKQGDKIIKDEILKAEIESKKIIYDGEKKSDSIKQIIISKENQKASKIIIQIKEEIIETCFSKAQQKLKKFNGREYENFLTNYIEKGIKQIGDNTCVKISKENDKEIVKKFGLKVIGKINSIGGLILISNDGKITLDYTIEGIIKREKDRIRIEIGKILF